MSFFIYNNNFYNEGTPVITADSHAFRYGDGLFETIKAASGKLLLEQYHFERLFFGLKMLGFDVPQSFTAAFLKEEIMNLLKKNDSSIFAKIRLVVFRGNGNLSDPENHHPNYIIQTSPLDDFRFNTEGLVIDLYENGTKSCDDISNLKTNSFLLYTLAAITAKKNNVHDCILLNTHKKICETSIANIFIIKDKRIYTPSLSEGCIAGVMRRWLLENIKFEGNIIIEKPLSIEDLEQADEVFLTNSIHPVRWVKQFKHIQYTNTQVQIIYNNILKTF